MKKQLIKIFLLSVIYFGFSYCLKAQVASSYTFSTDSVALQTAPLNLPDSGENLVGGTILAAGGPNSGTYDHVYPNVPIGFDFLFNGKYYSNIGISSNGFAWFGTTAPAANEYNPVSDNFGSAGVISVFGASLTGRNYTTLTGSGPLTTPESTIKYETIGTSPNQIFIVIWNNFSPKSVEDTIENDTTDDYNNYRMDLYLVLYQCSYVVEPMINADPYPWFSRNTAVSVSGECGLRGATSADYYNCSASCQPIAGFLGQVGVTELVPNSPPSGSNSTPTTLSTAACVPGTLIYQVDLSSPLGFDILGGNPWAWIYTPNATSHFAITSISATNPACTATAETVTVNANGGVSPYSLTWTATGGGAAPPNGNNPNVASFPDNSISTTFSSVGSGTINFTYTDSVGCTVDSSISVSIIKCSNNTITTDSIIGSPFCACTQFNVPFTSTGTFNAGNVYTAQLSDSTGNFSSPTNIGTLSSTSDTGIIVATIPCAALTGHHYRIRVISNNPGAVGSNNGSDIIINGSSSPSVAIFVTPIVICSGGTVQCTATASGATAPGYQWLVNGAAAGGDSTGFTTTLFNNGNSTDTSIIQCVLTSNGACSTVIDTSTAVDVTVFSTAPAGAKIVAAPGTTICAGEQVAFIATAVNPGPAPTFQWYVNNSPVGSNSSTFTDDTLNNGDSVYCILKSSNFCANPATGQSNTLDITISAPVTPSVTISGSLNNICPGTAVTFTPNPVNGGTGPTYQWLINDTIKGAGATFTTDSLINNDTVKCIMTVNGGGCVSTPTASDSIVMTVAAALALTITPTDVSYCPGTPTQMTVSGANSFTWTPVTGLSCTDCPNPFVSTTLTTIYHVTGTTNNCTATDSVVVQVICPGNFVPTAFSPNGDGYNDVLAVLGPQIANFDFKIFDRWGELVFETTNQDFGWDGTFKGRPALVGVYVWEISGTDYLGNKVLVQGKNSGSVALIR